MSHICMSHVTHVNESCHTYTCDRTQRLLTHITISWVMSHICMSHVTHVNKSCHTYACCRTQRLLTHMAMDWVMSHIWMKDTSNANKKCHMGKSAKTQRLSTYVWMSHVAHMNVPDTETIDAHHYELSHVAYVHGSCHTCEWVMSHI